jgi:Glycosyl hydrolase family 26
VRSHRTHIPIVVMLSLVAFYAAQPVDRAFAGAVSHPFTRMATCSTATSRPSSTFAQRATGQRVCAPSSHKVLLGVWQAGVPEDMSTLSTFQHDAGKKAAIVALWRDFGSSKNVLDVSWLQTIADQGSIPLIFWSPVNWDVGTSQAPYSLSAIISGGEDSYIRGWAQQLAAYGQPVFLLWGHQMNGNWYPWGDQPKKYVAAWRHIHDIFVSAGATNVLWVWGPNVFKPGSLAKNAVSFYPGNRYVDWVGLAGYNVPEKGWSSFKQLFSYAYRTLTARIAKPFMVSEMESGEATPKQAKAGKSKAHWIMQALTVEIPNMKRIDAFVWFNEDKSKAQACSCDWRIESSVASQHAFANAVRAPLYYSRWLATDALL